MHPEASDYSFRHIGKDTVNVALCNATDVHLHVRQRCALDAVLQRKAGIRKTGRVHHQAVEAFVGRLINTVDRFAFDVGIGGVLLPLRPHDFRRNGIAHNRDPRDIERPPAHRGNLI
jgi:hypothetical protein